MKKRIYGTIGLVFLLGALMPLGGTKETAAQVQVNVNLGPRRSRSPRLRR